MKRCPNCQAIGDDADNFCDQCQTLLVTVEDTETSVDAVSDETVAFDPMAEGLSATMLEARTTEDREIPLPSGFQSESSLFETTDCPYLKLELRKDLFFMSGVSIPLDIRITPKTSDLKRVLVWVSPQTEGRQSPIYEVPVTEDPEFGRTMRLSRSWSPDASLRGIYLFHVYVVCQVANGRVGEEIQVYCASTRRSIYSASLTGDNLQININAREAATINADLKSFLRSSQANSYSGFIDYLSRLPEKFVDAPLRKTGWRPADYYVTGKPYACDSLTITRTKDGVTHYYQLIARDRVILGRKAEMCDIVVADPIQAKTPYEHPNNTVSRQHAEILYNGDSVTLFDKSSFGTYINAVRPMEGGLRIPNVATIEFGYIKWKMELQRCYQRPDCLACALCPANEIQSIVFTRTDQVPETYLLIWECCDLSALDEDLNGVKIYRRNGGFVLELPSGKFHYLVPLKRPLQINNVTVSIAPYHQFGDVK